MLHLEKIISEPDTPTSRRDFFHDIWQDLKIIFVASTFPYVLRASQSSLQFKPTPFIQQNPWVKDEITDFLNQQEVRDALGFDPLNYKPMILEVKEGVSDHPEKKYGPKYARLVDPTSFGIQYDELTWINAYFFSNKDPEPYLITQELRRTLGKELKKEDYQEYLDKLTELREDPEMLKLYRGLGVAHEIAHIRTYYSYDEGNPLINLTDHGFTNRMEIKILTNLYKSGKVELEMCEKIINFFEKYLNINDNPYKNSKTKNTPQPQHEIDKYLRTHFGLR